MTTDSSQFSLVRGQYHRRKSGRNVHRSDGVLALSSIILRKYLISNRPSLTSVHRAWARLPELAEAQPSGAHPPASCPYTTPHLSLHSRSSHAASGARKPRYAVFSTSRVICRHWVSQTFPGLDVSFPLLAIPTAFVASPV